MPDLEGTERFRAYKRTVEILMEMNHYRYEAELIAERIIKALLPDEEPIELETCHQCAGNGYNLITIKHGGMSSSTYRLVCGHCFGTGKLLRKAVEYR